MNSLHTLRLIKGKLKTCVCSIPCECSTGMQGNKADVLRQDVKNMTGIYTSATQICSGRTRHLTEPLINLQDYKMHAKTSYLDYHIKQTTEMWLHLNSNSGDRDFKLNRAWNLTIRFSCTLSQIKEHGGDRRGDHHHYHHHHIVHPTVDPTIATS